MSSNRGKPKIIIGIICGALLILVISIAVLAWFNETKKWQETRIALEAKGQSLDWRNYERPLLPEHENLLALDVMTESAVPNGLADDESLLRDFSSHDYYSGLESWNTVFKKNMAKRLKMTTEELNEDLWPYFEELLEPYQAYALAIIEATEERESGQAIGEYQLSFEVPIIKYYLIRSWGAVLYGYALQALEAGDRESAFRTQKAFFTIIGLESRMPHLVDVMIDTVIIKNWYLPLFINGLVNDAWTDEQLEWFEYSFSQFDLVVELELALIAERASVVCSVGESRDIREFYIVGKVFMNKNLRVFTEASSEILEAYLDDGLVNPNGKLVYDRISDELGFDDTDGPSWKMFTRSSHLAAMAIPTLGNIGSQVAETQAYIDMAALSCALIRFHRTNDSYPLSLDALIPEYIATLPKDRIGGADYHYEPLNGGVSFKLWSIGWNGTDEGGKVAFRLNKKSGPKRESEEGDWVWPYPQFPELIELK